MNRAEFDEFRTQLKNSWQRLVLVDVDNEGKQVEIRRTVTTDRRYNTAIFSYPASLACRCHWSEAAAWCHGFRYGYDHLRSNPPNGAHDDNTDVISKLEKLKMYLYFDRESKEEPARFYIVSYDGRIPRWEDGTALDGFLPDNKIPTYHTIGEVERWWEGRKVGCTELLSMRRKRVSHHLHRLVSALVVRQGEGYPVRS